MTDSLSPRVLLISSTSDAEREMRRIGVSEGGVRAMAGKAETVVVKISSADVPTAHIIKQQMLSVGGDAAVARDVLTHGVDRTDVLVLGTHIQLSELAEKLSYQPFDLPSLGEKISALLDTLAPRPHLRLRARHHTLNLSERVHIMGVLNVTSDSFSDGGLYLRPTAALDHARVMIEEGADIIDIGGQSTRPGSKPIPESEELERVVPVIERLHEEWKGPISVDTYRARVAEEALKAGAAIVNDITAFTGEPATAEVTARFDAACVLMHMQGTPSTMQRSPAYEDLMGEIALFLQKAAERAVSVGIGEDQIVLDPGLGFGKTTEHNLSILRHLPELAVLGRPILVGASRKAFIGKVLDLPVEDRLEGTLATAAYAIVQGARVLRVHEVRPIRRTARMVEACLSARA
jgi:dihydropteroate synthase